MGLNPYDKASRTLLRELPSLLAWLLRLRENELDFEKWLPAQTLPWPGEPDRTCDTVADVRDDKAGGRPWAVAVEFQIDPDEEMFGRGLEYLGGLWRALRPGTNRGDRFCVGLVVVNLRGRGTARQDMALTGTPLFTNFGVVEINLCELRAAKTLAEIASGEAPASVLPLIPLFHGAGEAGIVEEWKRLASAQTDTKVRRVLRLVRVFADAAGFLTEWESATEGLDVIQSKVWDEYVAEYTEKSVLRELTNGIVRILGRRGTVPPELERAVRAIDSIDRLNALLDAAADSKDIADFRAATNL